MPSRPACVVLGIGIGALLTPLWQILGHLLHHRSVLYPHR